LEVFVTFRQIRLCLGTFAAAATLSLAAALPAGAQAPANDYPTEARADYVFGCMGANGETPDMLRRCSCSVDVIASILPYDDYVRAETIISVLQKGGENVAALRSPSQTEFVANLRRAQAEGEVRCF
jgi:hypothetical protein